MATLASPSGAALCWHKYIGLMRMTLACIICKIGWPPAPGPGKVVIHLKAAGVNFPDVFIIQGKYQFMPALPFIPGSEVAGMVRALSAGVAGYRVGDRVIAFTGQGGFAQQLAVAATSLMPMPPDMDFDTAAAITLTYGTSHPQWPTAPR